MVAQVLAYWPDDHVGEIDIRPYHSNKRNISYDKDAHHHHRHHHEGSRAYTDNMGRDIVSVKMSPSTLMGEDDWYRTGMSRKLNVKTQPAGNTRKEVRIDGDIVLGGLFPMHEKGQGGQTCGAVKVDKGIQRMEAMLYAVNKINNDPTILPTIKLGVQILDTCLRDTYALEQSLDFIKAHMNTLDVEDYRCADGRLPDHNPSKPVAGVIGAAASPVSIMVANILRLFKVRLLLLHLKEY